MNPAADVWAKVISLMQPDMTATTINTWFDDATAVALEDDRFVLYSPTRFKRDIIPLCLQDSGRFAGAVFL